jgi:tetratricopeptide (TPR) repeat protein
LRAYVINSLSKYRKSDITQFHYVSDIPQPPEAYIAHPYTLLQTQRLVGRQAELNLLTDWVTKRQKEIYWARILNIVAIGGMGKSALTWTWFNDIAPQEMKPLAGRMWWSFYESDASFENFVSRALAYVTRRSREEVQQLPPPEREAQLLAVLDREPFLLVLDGLERILLAYARMDAARMADDDIDQRTANYVARAIGLPDSAAQSFTGEHRLRKTADPRAGTFLRKLAHVRAARILVSTRLFPADLQTATGEPLPGCSALFLSGLRDDDALNLWRAFNVSGSRETLLPLFNTFGQHPLLLQALASEVANYRRAPGNFEGWQKEHPTFNPFDLPLVQARTHVLEFALHGLDDKARQVLQTIAAFRMPASYDTLAALFVDSPHPNPRATLPTVVPEGEEAEEGEEEEKLFPTELGLDSALKELEDRGLVGWDKRANRYDLHPIVRGVVWSGLPADMRNGVFTSLQAHFQAVPKLNEEEVSSLEDLTPVIELYNTLIGLERYDDAYVVFRDRLSDATLYRLSASRQSAELLEMLFPDGLDQLPCLSTSSRQAYTLNALALAYHNSGQPGRAVPLYRRNIILREKEGNPSIGLGNLSNALRLAGALRESEAAARRSLVITREQSNLFQEGVSLTRLGLTLATKGNANDSQISLQRVLKIDKAQNDPQGQGYDIARLAQRALWLGHFKAALSLADRAWELAGLARFEADFIMAARLQGTTALGLDDFAKADERLHHTLTRARAVNLVEEELPALVALAELRRRQANPPAARELLDEVWELAERGPYPLFHADAFNVLAQIERDAGNHAAAVEAASQAYRLAWCDGPPFAYHWGLVAARKHLAELGAPEPPMPPFDESKYEPMPEVEIDPEDEFHVGAVDSD